MMYRTSLTPLFTLRREMDRIFDDAFGARSRSALTWTPAMDVREEDAAWQFVVDLPGVAPEAVEVTVEAGLLTVSGERPAVERKNGEGRWHVAERIHGAFKRTFQLPERVNSEGITASFDHGVLTVLVPKAEAAKARKIVINVKG